MIGWLPRLAAVVEGVEIRSLHYVQAVRLRENKVVNRLRNIVCDNFPVQTINCRLPARVVDVDSVHEQDRFRTINQIFARVIHQDLPKPRDDTGS